MRGTTKQLAQQQHDASNVQSVEFEWQQQLLHSARAAAVAPQSHRQLFAQQPVHAGPAPPLYALLAPSPPPPLASPLAPPPMLMWQPTTQLHPPPPPHQLHQQSLRAPWATVTPREEKEDFAARKQLASIQPLATAYDSTQQQQLQYVQQLWAQHNFLQQQLQHHQQQQHHAYQLPQSYQQQQQQQPQRSMHRPASSPDGGSSPRPSAAEPASSPRGSALSHRSGHKAQAVAPSATTKHAAVAAALAVAQASRNSKRSSLPAPLVDHRSHNPRPGTSPYAAPTMTQSSQHHTSSGSRSNPHSLLQSGSSDDDESYFNSDAIYTLNGQAASHFPMPPSSSQRQHLSDEDSDTETDRHKPTRSLALSFNPDNDPAMAADASPSLGSGSASPTAAQWSREDESFVEGLAASFGRGPSAAPTMQPPASVRHSMRTTSSLGSRPVVVAPTASASAATSRPGSSNNQTHSHSRSHSQSHSRRASDLHHRVAALLAQQQPQQQPQQHQQQHQRSSSKPRPKSTSGNRPHGNGSGNFNFKPRIGSAPHHRLTQQQQRRPQSSGMLSPRSPSAAAQEAAAIFASSAAHAVDAFPARPRASADEAPTLLPLDPPARSLFLSRDSPFFSRLPDELWSEIMSLLGGGSSLLCGVARLNREASRAVRDPEWWRHVKLGTGFAARLVMQQRASNQNAVCGGGSSSNGGDRLHPELSALRSGPSTNLPSRLLALSTRWSLMESLDLSGVGAVLTDDFFVALTGNSGGSVARRFINTGNSSNDGGSVAARYWARSLRSLSLARCTLVTDATLAALAPCCLSLRSFDLSGLSLLTDEGFAAFLAQIRGTRGRKDQRRNGRAQRFGSQLQHLKLNRCYGLGDGALEALAAHAPRLQDLDLTFCNRVTDAGLAALGSLMGSRESEIKGVSTSSTRDATPGLRQLSLRWCRSITDVGVRSLFCADRADEDDQNGSTTVLNAPRRSSSSSSVLSYLNVDHCSLLTDESVACIAAHGASALRQLSMVFCTKVRRCVSTRGRENALLGAGLVRFAEGSLLLLRCSRLPLPSS